MLAYADTADTDFPYIGSTALYQGQPVTIHQRTDDGRALIFGPAVTARVPVTDLSPVDSTGVFDQWRAARIDPEGSPFTLTVQTDLYVDFACWLEAQGHDPDLSGSPTSFARQLSAAGFQQRRVRIASFVPGRTATAPAWNVLLIREAGE